LYTILGLRKSCVKHSESRLSKAAQGHEESRDGRDEGVAGENRGCYGVGR
jgi:hypothetical protein